MKEITIITRDGPIILIDDDDRPSDQIAQELSDLMKVGTITLVKTSTHIAIIRPSAVTGIVVRDDTIYPTQEATLMEKTTDNKPQKNKSQKLEQNVEENPEEEIDIIKDME